MQRHPPEPTSDAAGPEAIRGRRAAALLIQGRDTVIDRLAQLAAQALDMPQGQVSILTDRQIIAGAHGLDLPSPQPYQPLEDSLCAVAVASGAVLAIEDAVLDDRVAHMAPITSGLVRAYLGVTVVAAGEAVGALCVYGPEPREWTARDTELLAGLGAAVSTELELGGVAAELLERTARLELGFAAAEIGSFDWNLRTDALTWDERLKALFGYSEESFGGHIDSFNERVHPDDRAHVGVAITEAIDACGDYATEFRIQIPGGAVRWVAARGRVLTGSDGRPESMLGAAYDITAARVAGAQVTRVLETMGIAFVSVGRDWGFTYVNLEAERLLRRTRADLLGRSLLEEFPDTGGTRTHEQYRQALDEDEPVAFEQYYPPLDRWFEVRAWPSPEGLSIFFNDISARVKVEQEQRRSNERLSVLADAGRRLAATLEVSELLEVLGEVVMPRYGDWVAVALREEEAALLGDRPLASADAGIRVAYAAGTGDGLTQRSRAALLGARIDLGRGGAWQRQAGRTVSETLEAAGEHALVAVPPAVMALVSRRRTVGAVIVGAPSADPADRRLLGELTGRAAVALDNAALYGAERRFGRALQHLLLPADLPSLPGIEAAVRYLAGTEGREVGGDFFIGHSYDDGRILFVIGDVMGHGMQAAARMGQLRAVVATYGFENDAPDRLLSRVASRTDDLLDLQMATMLVVVYDPAAQRLTVASAGHPPPLLATLGRPPTYIPVVPGPPLGAGSTEYASLTIDVPVASTVVLYTDGLVENRGESIDLGLDRLLEALQDIQLPPEAVCDHVLRKLGRTRGGSDDLALLVFSDYGQAL